MTLRSSLGLRTLTTFTIACVLGSCTMGQAPVRTIHPSLYVGTMGTTTRFEREMRRPIEDDKIKNTKVTPALFWTGTTLAAIGAAGTVGFGIAGSVMNRKVENGFDESGLDRETFDRYNDLGDGFNTAMVISGAVGLVGLSLAALVYGFDYSRCGPLAHKRRKCGR